MTRDPVICVSHGFQSNYERGFCNGLVARGVPVTLIGSDRTDAAGLLAGVHMVNLRGSQEEARPSWQKALNLVRYHVGLAAYTLWRRGAIVHVTGLIDHPVLGGVLEGLWFRLVGRRYVITVHNLLPHDRHSAWARRAYGWAYRLAHRLVVHTERMKRELTTDFGIDPGRVVVMEHGLEPTAPVALPVEQARTGREEPMILMFGKVAPYKGVDLLLHALREAAFPYRLVIAGHCPSDSYRAELRAAIQAHPHADRIEWRDGFVPESDMEQLFQEADLVALPYRHIDQSGVLFQALRFGTPVLATRVGEFERHITTDIGELAEPNDTASLQAALSRWTERRTTLSRTRIRQLGERFGWPATVLALREAYQ